MDFEEYSHKARYLAHKIFEDVPQGYEIDHIFSIHDGWHNKVPLERISHPANLQILDRQTNREKSDRSDITLEELMRRTKEVTTDAD